MRTPLRLTRFVVLVQLAPCVRARCEAWCTKGICFEEDTRSKCDSCPDCQGPPSPPAPPVNPGRCSSRWEGCYREWPVPSPTCCLEASDGCYLRTGRRFAQCRPLASPCVSDGTWTCPAEWTRPPPKPPPPPTPPAPRPPAPCAAPYKDCLNSLCCVGKQFSCLKRSHGSLAQCRSIVELRALYRQDAPGKWRCHNSAKWMCPGWERTLQAPKPPPSPPSPQPLPPPPSPSPPVISCAPAWASCWPGTAQLPLRCCEDDERGRAFGCYKRTGRSFALCKPFVADCQSDDTWQCPQAPDQPPSAPSTPPLPPIDPAASSPAPSAPAPASFERVHGGPRPPSLLGLRSFSASDGDEVREASSSEAYVANALWHSVGGSMISVGVVLFLSSSLRAAWRSRHSRRSASAAIAAQDTGVAIVTMSSQGRRGLRGQRGQTAESAATLRGGPASTPTRTRGVGWAPPPSRAHARASRRGFVRHVDWADDGVGGGREGEAEGGREGGEQAGDDSGGEEEEDGESEESRESEEGEVVLVDDGVEDRGGEVEASAAKVTAPASMPLKVSPAGGCDKGVTDGRESRMSAVAAPTSSLTASEPSHHPPQRHLLHQPPASKQAMPGTAPRRHQLREQQRESRRLSRLAEDDDWETPR